MRTVTRTQLLPGVFLTAVPTKKFKSSVLSMTLLAPLRKESATSYALIPYLLRRGTEKHPDLSAISSALDQLYGGSIEPAVRKKGETQCIGFVGSFLDDAYTLDGSPILTNAANLMGELLLHPFTQDGVFSADYTRQEKENLINRIRSEVNDKRTYATNRLIEEMCRDEPYGVPRLGREEDVASLTPDVLWKRYQDLLRDCPLEVYYCGSSNPNEVCSILQNVLAGLPRRDHYDPPTCTVIPDAPETKLVKEQMDVAQGKLTMGFRTGGITASSSEYPALMLCNALFGGTTTSKLFLNVREKLSLCYYASSSVYKYKGVMVVSSGVEFQNRQKAEDEILLQLEACQKGHFEPWEITGARRYTVSSLRTILDSQSRQEDYWIGQASAGLSQEPEELAEAVEQVAIEEAVAAAGKLKLDTVYFLEGMEA